MQKSQSVGKQEQKSYDLWIIYLENPRKRMQSFKTIDALKCKDTQQI